MSSIIDWVEKNASECGFDTKMVIALRRGPNSDLPVLMINFGA